MITQVHTNLCLNISHPCIAKRQDLKGVWGFREEGDKILTVINVRCRFKWSQFSVVSFLCSVWGGKQEMWGCTIERPCNCHLYPAVQRMKRYVQLYLFLYISGSPSEVPKPRASALPESLSEMKMLGCPPRLIESETLRSGPNNLFSKSSRWFCGIVKFENHCSILM